MSALCRYCGSPRVLGVRTCGLSCVRGVDPQLADLIGVLPWVVTGKIRL